MNGRPRTAPADEQQALSQKQRLKYLQDRYGAPQGVELYRLLGLHADGQRNVRPPESPLSRPIPSEWRSRLPTFSERVFAFRLEVDTSKRSSGAYLPGIGLNQAMRDALAWVIVDKSEAWDELSEEDFRQKVGDVANFLYNGSPQPAEIFHGVQKRWAEELTGALRNAEAEKTRIEGFLRGSSRPDLSVVNARATVPRTIEGRLLQRIRDEPQRLFVVTSAAGDGKSALMYRLGQRLYDEGWCVLFKHAWLAERISNWPIGRSEGADTVLLVDRADSVPMDIGGFQALTLDNPRLRIVLFAREINWLARYRALHAPTYIHVPLPRLDDTEIDALSHLIWIRGVVPGPVTKEELRARLSRSVKASEFPHMLAAMMTACRGGNFEDILRSMVADFPERQLLAWTALCAVTEARDKRSLYLTHRIGAALMCGPDDKLEEGDRRFMAKLQPVSSEIIGIGDSRYDLRHPDISRFVLSSVYQADSSGVLTDTTLLGDDLHALQRAMLRIFQSGEQRIRGGVPPDYLFDFPRYWWSSRLTPDHEIGRQLYEHFKASLGTVHADRFALQRMLADFMNLERSLATDDERSLSLQREGLKALTEVIEERLILANGDEKSRLAMRMFEALRQRIELLHRLGEIGPMKDPPADTVRGVLRHARDWNDGWLTRASVLSLWAEFDGDGEGLGDAVAPLPSTLRSAYRNLWNDHHDKLNSRLLADWFRVEAKAKNWGELINPEPYTARWLMRTAWAEKDQPLCDESTVVQWAEFEAAAGNIGPGTPEDFSARRLLRACWDGEHKERFRNSEFLRRWAGLEARHDNVGNDDKLEPYSARWLYRTAWEQSLVGLVSAAVMAEWAELEAREGKIGDFDNPLPYTARWICRLAWQEDNRSRLCNAHLMYLWSRFEYERNLGNATAPDDYTGRWVLRQAWREGLLTQPSYIASWALMEADLGNAEVEPAPVPFSAHWLLRTAWEAGRLRQSTSVLAWVKLAGQSGKPEGVQPAQYSPRWIFRTAFEEAPRIFTEEMFWGWGLAEISANNLGEVDAPPARFTARWVAAQMSSPRASALLAFVSANEGKLGDFHDPDCASARGALRELFRAGHRFHVAYWAKIETAAADAENNVHLEFGASWLANLAAGSALPAKQ